MKYSIRRHHLWKLSKFFGERLKFRRNPGKRIETSFYEYAGLPLRISCREKNPFWFSLSVDDPTAEFEKQLWSLLDKLPLDAARLSEIEVAYDLLPVDPRDIDRLQQEVLAHFVLPRARHGARPYRKAGSQRIVMWYFGSQRGGPRHVKVYQKKFSDTGPEFLRIEWTIHGRFAAYGIEARNVTVLSDLRLDKMFAMRRFNAQRAAGLVYRRMTGKRISKKDPWIGVTLAHYRTQIVEELNPKGIPLHMTPLANWMKSYRDWRWSRSQDMNKVFPILDG